MKGVAYFATIIAIIVVIVVFFPKTIDEFN